MIWDIVDLCYLDILYLYLWGGKDLENVSVILFSNVCWLCYIYFGIFGNYLVGFCGFFLLLIVEMYLIEFVIVYGL